jgi:phenylalanine-4-hydroxylase
MSFAVARQAISELDRVLARDGLAYIDLISSDNSKNIGFLGEKVMKGDHEMGTIQSYFNADKIQKLIEGTQLSILEAVLIRRETLHTPSYASRYHLVLEHK